MGKYILLILILIASCSSCEPEKLPERNMETIRIATPYQGIYQLADITRKPTRWVDFKNGDGDYSFKVTEIEEGHQINVVSRNSIQTIYSDVEGEAITGVSQTYNNSFQQVVSEGSVVMFKIVYK